MNWGFGNRFKVSQWDVFRLPKDIRSISNMFLKYRIMTFAENVIFECFLFFQEFSFGAVYCEGVWTFYKVAEQKLWLKLDNKCWLLSVRIFVHDSSSKLSINIETRFASPFFLRTDPYVNSYSFIFWKNTYKMLYVIFESTTQTQNCT